MINFKKIFLLSALLCVSLATHAQRNVTTVGLQLKPIFPLDFLGTGATSSLDLDVKFTVGLKSGFAGGMVIRRGISDLLSIESGINYVKRKYDLQIQDKDFEHNASFRIIGYEIPLSLLVFIQLSDKLYMNASMGGSLDMFASAVQIYDTVFNQVSLRNRVMQGAVIANLGWEWRTEKSGYIYIGASYHRPFNFIYLSRTQYYATDPDAGASIELLGNYLTLDLRYFFHEDPEKKKTRKKK
ncbi:MAG: hypothetical protein EYC69_08415 [Bacteroidetes bacterium]|nr:MAG: hypothetical protein EYC69_08415 [Bacteroidota bacterium]